MVKHGRLILRLSPALDATLKALLTSPAAAQVHALRSAYLDDHRRIVTRAERHRVLLYAASLLLLVYLAVLFIRLQSGANALTLSNAGLKKETSERRQAADKASALQRSEEPPAELQSLIPTSYPSLCLKNKNTTHRN